MELNNGQKIGLVGGIIALVAFFLPWASVASSSGDVSMSLSISGFQLGGLALVALISAILVLVFSVINQKTMPILTIVFAIIGLLLVFVVFAQIKQAADAIALMNAAMGSESSVEVGYGIGLWIAIVGFIIGLVGGIMSMKAMKASDAPPAMPPQEPEQF